MDLGTDEAERMWADQKRLFCEVHVCIMNVNMQIADHSGTFCSSLSGYVQIRGLKERG